MIFLYVYKWRDVIFTLIEMLFLLYLLKTKEHNIRISDHKKKLLQILAIAVLFFYIIISSYFQINMLIKTLGQVVLVSIIAITIYGYGLLQGIIYAVIYMISIIFGEMIAILVFGALGIDGIVSMQQNNAFSLQLLVVSKIIILFLMILLKALFERSFTELKDGWLICISNLSYVIVFMGLEYTLVRQNEVYDQNYSIVMIISVLLLLFVLILNNLLWKCFIKIKRQEKQEALKQDELRVKSEYYYEKAKSDEEIREIYHDLRNHLLMLRAGEVTDGFVTKLEEKIKEHKCFLNTGNDYLDILLNDKMRIALSKDIKVNIDVDFRETDFVEPLDISSIFGNMFDNAIEACEKISNLEERFINLHVIKKNSMLIIKMENSILKCEGNQKTFNTTKINKNLHGFGLRSIQKAIEKYGGTVRIECQNSIFLIITVIPNSEGVGMENGQIC